MTPHKTLFFRIMTSRPNADSRARSRRGFSLIEVMIASLVLMLVLVSSITALQMGFRVVDNARMSILAGEAIESQIENLRLLNWSYIGGTPTPNPWFFQSKQFTSNLVNATQPINFRTELNTMLGNVASNQLGRITKFDLTVTPSVDPDSGATRSDLVRLKVNIAWTALNGKQQFEREFETFYSKAGMSDYYYSSNGN